jgi:hypothetical protein
MSLIPIIALGKVTDTKSNFLRPENFFYQGFNLKIITKTAGSTSQKNEAYFIYNSIFQYLKKTDPKILIWTMAWFDYSYYINPKLKDWDEAYFISLFKDNAGLSNDYKIDYRKLFIFLKNYKYDPLDEVNVLKIITNKTIPISGGKKKRKINKSTKIRIYT